MSLPVPPLVRALSEVGRRAGVVGVAGRSAEQVVASRDAVLHPAVALVSRLVQGGPSKRVRISRARSGSGLELVVHTPTVEPGTVLPVVVHLHGGGWALGDVRDTPWWVTAMAEQTPAVVVSVGYRLAPEAPFPAATDDCLEAVRWVASHPAQIGAQCRVRTDRLALAGDSAGANLAAVTALRLRDEPRPGDPTLVHQVLVYPAVDATLTAPSVRTNAHAPMLTRADVVRFLELYTAGATRRAPVEPTDPWLSPLHAPDLSGLPPTTVLTAEHDPLHDEGVALAQRLTAAGVAVRLSDYPGAVHGFLSMAGLDRVRSRHAMAEIVAALRSGLTTPP